MNSKAKPFAWSYSALKNFQTCPRRYQAYSITKEVVEPVSEELDRGYTVHKAFDARVSKGVELPVSLRIHERSLATLANAPGQVFAERKLALTPEFTPAGWVAENTWFRIVIDYHVLLDDDLASVVDYKTGKPSMDDTQLELTAATLFAHYPSLQRVKTALMFVFYDDIRRRDYRREDITSIWASVLPKVLKLWHAREHNEYPPIPGGLCRKYCAVRSCPYNGR